jgi:outer membrane protein TolC
MVKRLIAIALGSALSGALSPASADDLLEIYRDALTSDPVLASARANWVATQENVPQARAGLLPSVGLAANATEEDFYEKIHVDPALTARERFPQLAYTVSASQPLARESTSRGSSRCSSVCIRKIESNRPSSFAVSNVEWMNVARPSIPPSRSADPALPSLPPCGLAR